MALRRVGPFLSAGLRLRHRRVRRWRPEVRRRRSARLVCLTIRLTPECGRKSDRNLLHRGLSSGRRQRQPRVLGGSRKPGAGAHQRGAQHGAAHFRSDADGQQELCRYRDCCGGCWSPPRFLEPIRAQERRLHDRAVGPCWRSHDAVAGATKNYVDVNIATAVQFPVFKASGATHAQGAVPDPVRPRAARAIFARTARGLCLREASPARAVLYPDPR